MEAVLPRGAEEFLSITFDQLEARFGRRLIGSICAYLTISETGLCDLELIDTLSLDDEVLNELQATAGRPDAALVPEAEPGPLSSARPRYRRFPALLWYMLKSEMAGVLLRNAHSNGIKAFTWINDAVANCVWTRYLHGQDLTYFYQHLAALFRCSFLLSFLFFSLSLLLLLSFFLSFFRTLYCIYQYILLYVLCGSGLWHNKPKPVLTGANAQRESPPALDGPIAEASPHAEVAAAAAMNESPSPTPTPHTPRALQLRPADERPPPPPPPALVDRIVPSQPVVWRFVEDASGTRPPQLRFNLRKIEQLPRHLNLSRASHQSCHYTKLHTCVFIIHISCQIVWCSGSVTVPHVHVQARRSSSTSRSSSTTSGYSTNAKCSCFRTTCFRLLLLFVRLFDYKYLYINRMFFYCMFRRLASRVSSTTCTRARTARRVSSSS